MHLKLLIVPFLIIMVLVLAIGFIKPDIDAVQRERANLVAKEKQRDSIEAIVQNIQSLTGVLDSKKESEQFISSYFPAKQDHERVIDSLNYSAIQSGVLVESMTIKDVVKEPLDAISLDTTVPAEGMSLTPVYQAPVPESFTTTVVVRGSYENIRDFLTRAAHMNRFQKMSLFSIANPKDAEEEIAGDNLSNLEGTFTANFDYIAPQEIETALGMSVFEKTSIDMTAVEKALAWVTNLVPQLEKPGTGKPNPFQ